jgi:hypothetical protein
LEPQPFKIITGVKSFHDPWGVPQTIPENDLISVGKKNKNILACLVFDIVRIHLGPFLPQVRIL